MKVPGLSEPTSASKKAKKQEIDEVEDLILEDFSFSDNNYSDEGSDSFIADIV